MTTRSASRPSLARRLLLGGALAGAGVLVVPGVAHAASDPYTTPPPQDITAEKGPTTEVLAKTATAAPAPAPASTQTLPFTGGDVAGIALIGAGAVGAGAVVLVSRRKAVKA